MWLMELTADITTEKKIGNLDTMLVLCGLTKQGTFRGVRGVAESPQQHQYFRICSIKLTKKYGKKFLFSVGYTNPKFLTSSLRKT